MMYRQTRIYISLNSTRVDARRGLCYPRQVVSRTRKSSSSSSIFLTARGGCGGPLVGATASRIRPGGGRATSSPCSWRRSRRTRRSASSRPCCGTTRTSSPTAPATALFSDGKSNFDSSRTLRLGPVGGYSRLAAGSLRRSLRETQSQELHLGREAT